MRFAFAFALACLPSLAFGQGGMGPGPGTPHSAGGAVTSFSLVAHTQSVPGQSTSTSPAIDTSTANLCIVKPSWAFSSFSGLSCAANISDSKSNTWKDAAPNNAVAPTVAGSAICYASPCTTGTGHTFTVAAANVYGSVQVAAFKGAGTITTVQSWENAGANSGSANATTQKAGPVSAQRNFMLAVSGATSTGQSNTFSVSAPFTITDQQPWNATTGGGGALAYNLQTNATMVDPTWTSTVSAPMAASNAIFVGTAPTQAAVYSTAPCDLLSGGCQEAWSLQQKMVGAYSGPLFKLGRNADGTTLDVGTSGGMVDLSTWTTVCYGNASNCWVITIYAQVNHANDLHFSTLSNAGDNARPDCTTSAHVCASPLTFNWTTGLPEIATNVAFGPPRLGYQYLIGTTGTDGTSTGIASGNAARSLVEYGQYQGPINACCGHWGPTAHQLGLTGSSFMIALGYGDPGPGVLECNGNVYCATIDCEAGAGCNPATFPPSPAYSTQLPSNSLMIIAKYDPTSRVTSMSFNAANYYSVTSNPGYMATGTHFGLGGGGDFTTPAPVKFWGGFITGAVMTQTDETNLLNNIKATLPAASFP